MNLSDEIQRLNDLKENGTITEEEFAEAKQKLLHQSEGLNVNLDTGSWGMIIHLSQLCGFLLPLAGSIVPIVIWQLKKAESPAIDRHGRIVANWMISEFIYFIICGILTIVLIGIPLIFVLLGLGILFPIIGAVKASNGDFWNYPMSIKFFGVSSDI